MPQRGTIRPGSVSDIILTRIKQGEGSPVPRGEIARRLEGRARRWLGQSLGALAMAGHIVSTPAGYRLAGSPAEAPLRERKPCEVPELLRCALAPILGRARHYAQAGRPCDAEALLQRAAAKVSLDFVAEDLRALADLFGRAGQPYRDVDLGRRAAA